MTGGRRRVVVATADPLGDRMPGTAIRAWHMAEVLAAEHDVRLVTTRECTRSHPLMEVASAAGTDIADLERWAEVLVLQAGVLHATPVFASSEKTVVVDVYDPFHLESLEQGRGWSLPEREAAHAHLVGVLNHELRRGDFFLCANDRQRDFWTGSLASLGRVNPSTYDADVTLRKLLAVVPSGVPALPPVRGAPALRGVVEGIEEHDKVVLWAGGVYNWLDPLTVVRAVDRLRHRLPEIRLFFLGMQHPNPGIPPMRMAVEVRRLADELGLVGRHVFFNDGWVEYDFRGRFLLEADVGVSAHLDHVETTYSSRTRILDYLWAGLPVVATEGDSWAELVGSEGLGCTVPPGDVHAMEQALARILTEEGTAGRCRAAMADVVPRFAWDQVMVPLSEFCREPARAPDLGTRPADIGSSPARRPLTARLAAAYRHGGSRAVLRGAARRAAAGVLERLEEPPHAKQ